MIGGLKSETGTLVFISSFLCLDFRMTLSYGPFQLVLGATYIGRHKLVGRLSSKSTKKRIEPLKAVLGDFPQKSRRKSNFY